MIWFPCVYTHADEQAQRDALTRLHDLFDGAHDSTPRPSVRSRRCTSSGTCRTSRPPGEVVIFDRSWYNRAGVEPVMGFCTPEETERFLELVPGVEKAMGSFGDRGAEVLAGGQRGRADPAAGKPHPRPAEDLEALRPGPEVPTAAGMTTPEPATRCSPRRTPRGRPGTSRTPTIRNAAGSTSSATCSARSPTSPSPSRTSRCPNGSDAAVTPSRTCRCGTSRARY